MDRSSDGASARPGVRRAAAGFPADLASAGMARTFVDGLCRSWGVPSVVPEAEIIVTELVENAIRHCHSSCEVAVALLDDTLTIEVGDHGRKPPRLLEPSLDAFGGRGLLLVHKVSRRWGYQPTADGKIVWADVAVV